MTASDASAQAGPSHIQFARSMIRKRFVLSNLKTPGGGEGLSASTNHGRTCGRCDDKCVCFYLLAEAEGFEEVCGGLVLSKAGAQKLRNPQI